MGFNIPMNTTGAMNASSLLSLNNGGQAIQQQNQGMNNQQQYNQSVQQQYTQPVQQQYTQPVQQQNQQMNQQMSQVNQQMTQPVQPKQRPSGNGVHLKKGQRVNLGDSSLQNIQVCLGWDVSNMSVDLDASAFLLGEDNRVIGDDWFVFYGQLNSPDGSVIHSGDSLGEGVGDDEIISVNLRQINQQVQKIVFIITIDEALEKNLNFSMVQNAYVRVVNTQNNQELIKFTLTDYYSNVTAMVVGEIYNKNGQWKFNAVGDGVSKDLAGLCGMYGVNVAD